MTTRGPALRRAAAVAAACLIAVAPAYAGTRQAATVLYSEDPAGRAFQERYGYNDAIILADGTVYLSGVVAGLAPGETDLTAAYERAYVRIGSILVRAGVTWEDVVGITSFHTDVIAQVDAMAAVQKKYIAPPYASWTAIGVSRLLPDRGITEIKIVAKKPAN